MAATLVTLVMAKAHLRLPATVDAVADVDLQLKLDQAEAIILDYLSTGVDAAWVSPTTVHPNVSAAILLMLARLFEHRGDLEKEDKDLWEAIDRLLVRFRPSAIA